MSRTKHNDRRSRHSNIAARMGRWSAATGRPRRSAGSPSSSSPSGSAARSARSHRRTPPGPGESGRMDRILDAGFKQPAGESVLVQSRSLRTSDPAFKAAVADVVAASRS